MSGPGTAGLATFAKVRALHDRTTNAGEKASAAARMQALARKAGMTVEQAVSKLDKPKSGPATPRNLFEELFNTPEARAAQARREQRAAKRRAAILAEIGSEEAVWAETERETALMRACRPVVTRKPIIGGEIDTLLGWDGGRLDRMPPAARAAVSGAYALPATVCEAWAEFASWERLTDDRCAFCPDYSPDVRTRARTVILEHLLNTLPAGDLRDLRARLDWMQHVLDLGFSQDIHEDQACLATLRADIERMGARIREGEQGVVSTTPIAQSGRGEGDVETSPSSTSAVQSGRSRRTNVDKRRDVLALLGLGLTDREIARRAGVSPSTVGAIRRSAI